MDNGAPERACFPRRDMSQTKMTPDYTQWKVEVRERCSWPCILSPWPNGQWPLSTDPMDWVPGRRNLERGNVFSLSRNTALRTDSQDGRTLASGFVGDSQQSLSSEGAGLVRTAYSLLCEVDSNSQLTGPSSSWQRTKGTRESKENYWSRWTSFLGN